MLSCSEVTRVCASDELGTATWPRRLAVRLHLFMCRHCRRYVRELAGIGSAVRHLAAEAEEDRARAEAVLKNVFGDQGPDSP